MRRAVIDGAAYAQKLSAVFVKALLIAMLQNYHRYRQQLSPQ